MSVVRVVKRKVVGESLRWSHDISRKVQIFFFWVYFGGLFFIIFIIKKFTFYIDGNEVLEYKVVQRIPPIFLLISL